VSSSCDSNSSPKAMKVWSIDPSSVAAITAFGARGSWHGAKVPAPKDKPACNVIDMMNSFAWQCLLHWAGLLNQPITAGLVVDQKYIFGNYFSYARIIPHQPSQSTELCSNIRNCTIINFLSQTEPSVINGFLNYALVIVPQIKCW